MTLLTQFFFAAGGTDQCRHISSQVWNEIVENVSDLKPFASGNLAIVENKDKSTALLYGTSFGIYSHPKFSRRTFLRERLDDASLGRAPVAFARLSSPSKNRYEDWKSSTASLATGLDGASSPPLGFPR